MNGIQKSIKILAICFAFFIIANIVSSIFFSLSFISSFGQSNNKSESFSEVYDYIDEIDINLSASKLTIKEGTEFKVEAEKISNTFTSKLINNTLRIEENKKWFLHKHNAANIIIYVPKGEFLDQLLIDSGAGSIEISNILVNNFKINQGAGLVKITNSEFNKTNINGGVGEVKIINSILNDLDLESGVGSVNINSSITGNSNIESGIGKIALVLDNESNYQLEVTKGIGSIYINNKTQANDTIYGSGNNKLKIDGGIGEINIKFNN